MGEEGRVHQPLAAGGEIQIIGRIRIHASGDRLPGQETEALLFFPFFSVQPFQLQPGGEAAQGAAEGFQIGAGFPVVDIVDAFDRYLLPQPFTGQSVEDRTGRF